MARLPHDEPTAAVADQGEVMLDGPDGIAASFTPRAASLSAEAIAKAAREAEEQGKRSAKPPQ